MDKNVIEMIESVGGNPDHRCYEILKGEMGFLWKEVDEC